MQCVRNGFSHGIMDPFLLRKANLMFCGMDIDIHLIEGNLKKKDRHGILPFHQSAAVSFEQSVLYNPVMHEPAVYIYINPP